MTTSTSEQTRALSEYCDSRGVSMRVDLERAVVRGTKILGLSSRNGRTYRPEALAAAAGLYEGAKVNVNHPKGHPLAPRDYQDRIGLVRNVEFRPGEGLFGDFHFNPKHPLAEQLAWDAEHAPENVGFSHNVQARVTRHEGQLVVEAIERVNSVDLVADPATTRGLFEATGDETPLIDLSAAELRLLRPDLIEAIEGPALKEAARLEAELDRLKAAQAAEARQQAVRDLLAEFHLPDPDSTDPTARSIVSPQFLSALAAAPDTGAMRQLVEERAALVVALRPYSNGHAARPVAREQVPAAARREPFDPAAFVKAIT